jgi:hypothetical protein
VHRVYFDMWTDEPGVRLLYCFHLNTLLHVSAILIRRHEGIYTVFTNTSRLKSALWHHLVLVVETRNSVVKWKSWRKSARSWSVQMLQHGQFDKRRGGIPFPTSAKHLSRFQSIQSGILPSYVLLCSVTWSDMDVSGPPIGPIFKGQAVQVKLWRGLWWTEISKTCFSAFRYTCNKNLCPPIESKRTFPIYCQSVHLHHTCEKQKSRYYLIPQCCHL